MAKKGRVGKGGSTVNRPLKGGRQLHIQDTPSGTRAMIHDGGKTIPVDSRAFGVRGTGGSIVGGDNSRVTVATTDGDALDFTRHDDSTSDTVLHDEGISKPEK